MRYRPLGQSGLLVSVVGLGCNNFGGRLDVDGTRAVVDAAIDAGITLFDTSDTYGGGGGLARRSPAPGIPGTQATPGPAVRLPGRAGGGRNTPATRPHWAPVQRTGKLNASAR